jgi:hypothetical protein
MYFTLTKITLKTQKIRQRRFQKSIFIKKKMRFGKLKYCKDSLRFIDASKNGIRQTVIIKMMTIMQITA